MLSTINFYKAVFRVYKFRTLNALENWHLSLPSIQPQFALASPAAEVDLDNDSDNRNNRISDIFDGILHFAVPKKKMSVSRKGKKQKKFLPEAVNWHFCKKCGEPKLPHRICTKFKDICALTTDQWMAKNNIKVDESSSNTNTTNNTENTNSNSQA